MLFKSLGIASATNNASNSEDAKPVTIRLTDGEVQLYDAVAKAMGLTRQDFLAHLIRSNFKQALTDFLIGYTESAPSVSLSELILSQTDKEETKQKISWLLRSISQELMEADEKAIQEHLATSEHTYYEFATPRKGIFPESKESKE
jgi:hypothetical protein